MNACSTALPGNFRAAPGAGFARSLMLLVGALLMLLTGGCATLGAPYAPESSLTARQDLKALQKEFNSASMIDAYFKGPDDEKHRNEFIAKRLVLYDLAYADWISRFRFGRAAESTILDTATLGISQAIALIGGVRTKEALGAISGAILGTRSAYEKNFYDEQTAGAITAQMNAERKAALIPIMAGTRATIQEYPFTQALVDLNNYQYSGTIDGALSGIHREAGIKEARANAVLDRFRSVAFAPDELSDRIWKWLHPGMTSRVNGRPVDKDLVAIPINAANRDALRAEIARVTGSSLNYLPIQTFIDSAEFEDEREQVVRALNIP